MSWKAVEMQVALPRTHDAGRIQEQIQQRGQFMQDVITADHLQKEELKRKTVNELHQKVKLSNQKQSKNLHNKNSKEKNNQKNQEIDHPYLGNNIDING